MRRDHHAPREHVRDLRPVVPADDREQHVEARSAARGGHHVAVLDIEHIRLDGNLRKALAERLREHPVRGGAPAVQHTGMRQDERAVADRDEAGAPLLRATQRIEQLRRWHLVGIAPARDDDHVGAIDEPKLAAGNDLESAVRAQRRIVDGGDREAIGYEVEVRPLHAEEERAHRELEGPEAIVGDADDGNGLAHGWPDLTAL
jgi:hypothetical protein